MMQPVCLSVYMFYVPSSKTVHFIAMVTTAH